ATRAPEGEASVQQPKAQRDALPPVPFGDATLKRSCRFRSCLVVFMTLASIPSGKPQAAPAGTPKFVLRKSGLELERRTQSGSFWDVVGRKSAVLGYENSRLEAWVYPLKILDDFKLAFRLEGYPLDLDGPEIQVSIKA